MQALLNGVMQMYGMVLILLDLADQPVSSQQRHVIRPKWGNSRNNCESPVRGSA